jgi:hypothetical protein
MNLDAPLFIVLVSLIFERRYKGILHALLVTTLLFILAALSLTLTN